MSESTHVQTELSDEEYHHFKSLASERELSLTAALHEATELWMEKQQQVNPNDPLFEIIEQLEQEPVPETPRTNASTEDDLVEEWNGDTANIQFSDSTTGEK